VGFFLLPARQKNFGRVRNYADRWYKFSLAENRVIQKINFLIGKSIYDISGADKKILQENFDHVFFGRVRNIY